MNSDTGINKGHSRTVGKIFQRFRGSAHKGKAEDQKYNYLKKRTEGDEYEEDEDVKVSSGDHESSEEEEATEEQSLSGEGDSSSDEEGSSESDTNSKYTSSNEEGNSDDSTDEEDSSEEEDSLRRATTSHAIREVGRVRRGARTLRATVGSLIRNIKDPQHTDSLVPVQLLWWIPASRRNV